MGNKNILFTHQDWTDEKKKEYQKQYNKLKQSCRVWHKAPKEFKELKLWSYGKDNLAGSNPADDLWSEIIDEQLYEPILITRLTKKIW
jgi:hypothetical protein